MYRDEIADQVRSIDERTGRRPAPHEPIAWRRHNGWGSRAYFDYFGQYSEASMRKWMALRGHSYDLVLANGQMVRVGPRRAPC